MLNCFFGLSTYRGDNTLLSIVKAVSSTSHPAKGKTVNYKPIDSQILEYRYLFKVPVFRTVWTNFRKILNAKISGKSVQLEQRCSIRKVRTYRQTCIHI